MYIPRVSGYYLKKKKKNIVHVIFCLKIFFTFTNSVNPDEMQHNAAFQLVLHSLQKYPLRGFSYTKG